MEIAAVIVAAGKSSRMGEFKPMLNIGSISIAQRIIATFHKSGVEKIVMVTGYNADELEHHLANQGIVFLRNVSYDRTEMFDSARIGLSYVLDKCDRVLFTPIDIPLFTADTVGSLTASGAALAVPAYEGKTGHPIMISADVLPSVIRYDGEGGLLGALLNTGVAMTQVQVDDQGILRDADTPDDYQALLEYNNRQLLRPDVSVRLAREMVFLDEKIAMLLSLIDETGSVRIACKRMQISYSLGWKLIHTLESQIKCRLVISSHGGSGGGRSSLTETGVLVNARYEAYLKDIRDYANKRYMNYFGDVFR